MSSAPPTPGSTPGRSTTARCGPWSTASKASRPRGLPARATSRRCAPCGTGAPEVAEPMVLEPVTSRALDEGWIRAVLFDHRIDDWVDLGPDPIRRRHVGQIYADHVGAAYGAWKWLCDRSGG